MSIVCNVKVLMPELISCMLARFGRVLRLGISCLMTVFLLVGGSVSVLLWLLLCMLVV